MCERENVGDEKRRQGQGEWGDIEIDIERERKRVCLLRYPDITRNIGNMYEAVVVQEQWPRTE